MVNKLDERIYVVLDGLDECDEGSIKLLREKFEKLCCGNQSLRAVIVSRSLEKPTRPEITINIDQRTMKTKQDLLLFIYDRLEGMRTFKDETDPSQRDRLSELCKSGELDKTYEFLKTELGELGQMCRILLNRADETFLWAALAIDMLDDDAVEEILESEDATHRLLPRGLHAIVNRMLLNITINPEDGDKPETKAEDAAKIIRWVSLAFRPLTVAELRDATGVQSKASILTCKHILSISKDRIQDDTELRLYHLEIKRCLQSPSHMLPPSVALLLRPYLLRPLHYLLMQVDLMDNMDNILFATILLWARNVLILHLEASFLLIGICYFIRWPHRKSTYTRSCLEAFELSLRLCIFNIDEKEAYKEWFLKCVEILDPSIHEKKAHEKWFPKCSEIMETKNHQKEYILKKDMCKLQDPGALMIDVPKVKVEECLPQII